MKKIFLLSFCFSGLYLSAQDDRQIVIIERNQNTKKKTVNDNMPRRLVDHDQVFKFDPFRMVIGEVNFAYERVIGEQSSLEVELGPTVSNLGRFRFGVGNSGSQYRINSEMGVFVSGAYRFYPLDGRPALNQLYISPKFKYRRYNESMEGMSPSTLGAIKGHSDESIFTFNFGYQQWLADRFSFDYYFGIGLGSYRSSSYTAMSQYVGSEWQEVWVPQNERYTRFVATIGVKVGIGK